MSNDWVLLTVRFVPSPFSKEKESCDSKVKTLHPEISASHWGAGKSLQETMSSQVGYDSKEVRQSGRVVKQRTGCPGVNRLWPRNVDSLLAV